MEQIELQQPVKKRERHRITADPMRPCVWCYQPLNTTEGHVKYHPACWREKERMRQRGRGKQYYHVRDASTDAQPTRMRDRHKNIDRMRPCRWCGLPLDTDNSYQAYHPDCYTIHRRQRRNAPPAASQLPPVQQQSRRADPMRPCLWCQQPMNTDNPLLKYHRPTCYTEHRKARIKKVGKDPMRPCIECGKPLCDNNPIRKRHPACEKRARREYTTNYTRLVRTGKYIPRKSRKTSTPVAARGDTI